MDRMEQVKHLRTDPGGRHYNCAQSILVPFANEAGLGEEQAYQLGAMFGSGMNHGATCGVLTSALMLLGLKGYSAKEVWRAAPPLPGGAPGHGVRRAAHPGQGGGRHPEGAL